MKVKEIMKSPVITIQEGASIREAVSILSNSRISGLPVVDKKGKLKGIITEHDIIKNVMPTYETLYTQDESMLNNNLIDNRVLQIKDNPITTIMIKNVYTIDEDDSILKAASLIITKKVKRLPVLKGDEIIGIISRIDIVQAAIQGDI